MNKNIFKALITGLVVIYSCKSPAPSTPVAGPVPVNIHEVKNEAARYHETYPGTVVALNEVELRSEVSGFITNLFFEEGQTVQKGQKLYEIERSKFLSAYEQAKANLQVARTNLDRSQKDAERYTKLGEQDAIAKQRVDYALSDLQNAKQQVVAAQAQLDAAVTNLNHSLITAPFTGTIGISLVKKGAFVSAGQTLLNTVSSDDPVTVDFVVNEKEIYRFIKMQQQPPAKGDSTFTLLMPDQTLYPYVGNIFAIDRAVDRQTGTIKVRLQFPNTQKMLRSGMSGNVRVLNGDLDNPLVVPFKAVTEQMGEYFVYAVENDTARQRKVALGPVAGDKVVIKEGLNSGDKIVVDGIQKLREGSAVQIGIPASPAGGSAASKAAAK